MRQEGGDLHQEMSQLGQLELSCCLTLARLHCSGDGLLSQAEFLASSFCRMIPNVRNPVPNLDAEHDLHHSGSASSGVEYSQGVFVYPTAGSRSGAPGKEAGHVQARTSVLFIVLLVLTSSRCLPTASQPPRRPAPASSSPNTGRLQQQQGAGDLQRHGRGRRPGGRGLPGRVLLQRQRHRRHHHPAHRTSPTATSTCWPTTTRRAAVLAVADQTDVANFFNGDDAVVSSGAARSST